MPRTFYQPEWFPSLSDAAVIGYHPKGLVAATAHVAVSAHTTDNDHRIRFRPLYGWKVEDEIGSLGLELFGMTWKPYKLDRTYTGETLRSTALDLVYQQARIETSLLPETQWTD